MLERGERAVDGWQPKRIDSDLWPRRRTKPVRVTVSGSFHADNWQAVQQAVRIAVGHGFEVLSPRPDGMNKVARRGRFDFLAGDPSRSKQQTQLGHHRAILASDFLWIATPDGYIGGSTAMEIGVALTGQIPIFSRCRLKDDTVRDFVTVVRGINSAAKAVRRRRKTTRRTPAVFHADKAARLFERAARVSEMPAGQIHDADAALLDRVRRASTILHEHDYQM